MLIEVEIKKFHILQQNHWNRISRISCTNIFLGNELWNTQWQLLLLKKFQIYLRRRYQCTAPARFLNLWFRIFAWSGEIVGRKKFIRKWMKSTDLCRHFGGYYSFTSHFWRILVTFELSNLNFLKFSWIEMATLA